MKKILVLCLSLLLIGGCSAQAPSPEPPQEGGTPSASPVAENKKELIMGTNAEFPPFEFIADNGEFDGFDVAIAKEIAKEMNLPLRIENMAFDSLLMALETGRIDFIAAGMTKTPEREKNADFSTAYYNASQLIMVSGTNEEIKSVDDLKGKRIGVQEGTTGDLEASQIPDVTMSRFKKAIDAVVDLKNGKIDAVILDSQPSAVFIKQNPDLKLLDDNLTEEEYAIAVKKGNKEILTGINDAIAKMKADGRFDEITTQYIE